MRRDLLAWLALLGALALPAGKARAAEQPPGGQNQLTIDVGAASIGVTHAWRLSTPSVLFGGGGGIGLSPLLGKVVATGAHFDSKGTVEVAEVVHAQLFMRFELASWLRVDTGVRAGAFLHGGSSSVSGGPFAALFVAPALVWRWLWIGPRVSGGVLAERDGPTEGALTIEYVMLRFAITW
jgi:hypothetical protein